MRVLLDTHALLWWATDDARLSSRAAALIQDEKNVVLISAASAWEIATKVRLGKLPGAENLADDVTGYLRDQDFTPLPITVLHAQRAGLLPGAHKDPFDRMLIAQALTEDILLVSNETVFDAYGVRRVW